MRVALVSGNREKLPDAVIPFGLLYVAASIPAHHTRKFVDLCFEDDPTAALAAQLSEFEPDLAELQRRQRYGQWNPGGAAVGQERPERLDRHRHDQYDGFGHLYVLRNARRCDVRILAPNQGHIG